MNTTTPATEPSRPTARQTDRRALRHGWRRAQSRRYPIPANPHKHCEIAQIDARKGGMPGELASFCAAAAAAPIHDQANGTAADHYDEMNTTTPATEPSRPTARQTDRRALRHGWRRAQSRRYPIPANPHKHCEIAQIDARKGGMPGELASFCAAAAAAPIHDQANGTAADHYDEMNTTTPATEPSRPTARQTDRRALRHGWRRAQSRRFPIPANPHKHCEIAQIDARKGGMPGELLHSVPQQPRHRSTTKPTAPRLTTTTK